MLRLDADSKISEIKQSVGKPYFESENVLQYKMDCSEFMKRLNNEIIDLTITSPPYNIGKEYEKILKTEDYLEWCKKWMSQIFQVTSSFGSFWLNLGYFEVQRKGKCVPIPYLLWDKTPFYLLQEIVWQYGAGVSTKKYFAPRNEKYLWYVKNSDRYTFNLDNVRDKNVKYPLQKKNGKLKCNPLGKNPGNVWDIPKVTSGKNRSSKERIDHPAQFPLAILDRVIKGSSNENDLIFDPLIGSGSVAVSSIKNNRMVVGCEINDKYLEIAKERIENL